MDSALNPREIQSRIRAGESVDQVARAAGLPVEQVEAFATPVLAERRHQAASALASPVRRRGETGSHRALEVVVGDRLLSRGIDPDDVVWDAWRAREPYLDGSGSLPGSANRSTKCCSTSTRGPVSAPPPTRRRPP